MKILVIAPGFLPTIGGAEIGIHELYSRLGTRHHITILTPTLKQYPPLTGFDQSHYRVVRYTNFLDLGRLRGKRLTQGIIPPFSIGTWRATRQLLPQLAPDVVNVHYAAYSGLAALWTQKVCHIPTILSLVGRDATPGADVPRFWPRYSHWIAQQMAHTVFISQFCADFHSGLSNYSVIPYGTNLAALHPQPPDPIWQQQLGIQPDDFVLFTLQRLNPIKRVHLLIEAVGQLVAGGMKQIILLIAGTGESEPSLRQLVETHHLQAHIRFLGYLPQEQLNSHFALAHLFVFASAFETFGIVLAQALSAGLPVVAFANSAISEVVQDGLTGLLVNKPDAALLADKIRELAQNPVRRQQMSQAAREQAQQLYDWDRVANRYEQLFLTYQP